MGAFDDELAARQLPVEIALPRRVRARAGAVRSMLQAAYHRAFPWEAETERERDSWPSRARRRRPVVRVWT